ncbi:WD repeat-containing protein 27-like isoform X2 [Uloborus diversus]|uniref:WD repeat-containing protein 27-like isoform X2 n=1 Tax=Uloborus diversus TaxID=327109 RepID=UPI0024095942|nr:WD repeat-containing protein 27-like isoform X2 [Uloborus diversus]
MNTGKVVWHKETAGTRLPHLIAINEGSPYTSQDPVMHDLFLTSAVVDGIKIWDLRTKKVIVSYKEHKCRYLPCGATFSACGKYVLSGSEDKSFLTTCLDGNVSLYG